MRNQNAPPLKNQETLILSIHGELSDPELRQLETELLEKASRDQNLRYVILDVSGLESLDLFGARMLITMVQKLAIMDLQSVIVGLRPEVAINLTDMGMALPGVKTALSLEQGLRLIGQAKD